MRASQKVTPGEYLALCEATANWPYFVRFSDLKSACKGCGGPVFWAIAGYPGSERWFPINTDGGNHWDTCTHREQAA